MAENPRCQAKSTSGIHCIAPSTELHHRKLRGAYYLRTDSFMACCKRCHVYIHENGEWSKKHGYLINPASIHEPRPLDQYPQPTI